jgi:DNA-binding NarL/FixJ family response regulator
MAPYGLVNVDLLDQRNCMEITQGRLTTRELQVLRFLALGYSCREIAKVLTVSHKTVQCHRAHVMEKLEADEISTVVRYAIRNGLISP